MDGRRPRRGGQRRGSAPRRLTPTNPFSNFVGFTDSVDAGATGYNLFLATFSNITLLANSAAGLVAMDLSVGIPVGSMIFGFSERQPDAAVSLGGDRVIRRVVGQCWRTATPTTPRTRLARAPRRGAHGARDHPDESKIRRRSPH